MKTCLRSISLLIILLSSCAAPYRYLQKAEGERGQSAFKFKPVFKREVYRCTVDSKFLFKKFHFSGILFFKELDNGTTRVIFQNELGFAFFDFGWDKNDEIKVNQILPQLDKPALVKILEKDLNLFLMRGLDKHTEQIFKKGDETYYRFTLEKGFAYYIEREGQLDRIENAGKNKRVTTININSKLKPGSMPDAVIFRHHKAHFTIQLNKIDDNAAK